MSSEPQEQTETPVKKRNTKRKVLIFCIAIGVVMALFACAPQANTNQSDGSTEAGDTTTDTTADNTQTAAWWTTDTDCSLCHENSVDSLSLLKCEAAKSNDPNTTCMTCHSDTTKIEEAHMTVAITDTAGDAGRLKVSKIQNSACMDCHQQDDLVAATTDITKLTDTQGTTVNPHEATTTFNVNGSHDSISCGSCHKMHSEEDTQQMAYEYCFECHHTMVFECGGCH